MKQKSKIELSSSVNHRTAQLEEELNKSVDLINSMYGPKHTMLTEFSTRFANTRNTSPLYQLSSKQNQSVKSTKKTSKSP